MTEKSSNKELIRRQLNESAQYHILTVPRSGGTHTISAPGGGVAGYRMQQAIHRFQINFVPPSMSGGIRSANTVGEEVGGLDLWLQAIPHDFYARPDLVPPAEPLDRTRSQRVVLQEATVTFGDGPDGFRGFGTGRTFPMMMSGRPKLVTAVVGNVTEGLGKLKGHEGNFILCGDLEENGDFVAHLMVRFGDTAGELRTSGSLPAIQPVTDPAPHTTYFTYIAEKGHGADQLNHFSFAPGSKIPRGVNIPVELKRVCVDFALESSGGVVASDLGIGGIIGREIGFGRETAPRKSYSGTAETPFQFEGVSEYFLYDAEGRTVGSFVVDFYEGRTIETSLPQPPGQPALRFGYYGAIVGSKGYLKGLQGMMYGNGRSVFDPSKPDQHVISNHYIIRVHDPDGRFRAPAPGPEC